MIIASIEVHEITQGVWGGRKVEQEAEEGKEEREREERRRGEKRVFRTKS